MTSFNAIIIKKSDRAAFNAWLEDIREEHVYHAVTEYSAERERQAREDGDEEADGEAIIRSEMAAWKWEMIDTNHSDAIEDGEIALVPNMDSGWGDVTASAILSWEPPVQARGIEI